MGKTKTVHGKSPEGGLHFVKINRVMKFPSDTLSEKMS